MSKLRKIFADSFFLICADCALHLTRVEMRVELTKDEVKFRILKIHINMHFIFPDKHIVSSGMNVQSPDIRQSVSISMLFINAFT